MPRHNSPQEAAGRKPEGDFWIGFGDQFTERAGGVAEGVGLDADSLEEGEPEVGQRGLLGCNGAVGEVVLHRSNWLY